MRGRKALSASTTSLHCNVESAMQAFGITAALSASHRAIVFCRCSALINLAIFDGGYRTAYSIVKILQGSISGCTRYARVRTMISALHSPSRCLRLTGSQPRLLSAQWVPQSDQTFPASRCRPQVLSQDLLKLSQLLDLLRSNPVLQARLEETAIRRLHAR